MNKGKEIYMYVLGALIILSFFVVIGLLIFQPIPDQNNEVLYLVIGADIGFAGAVVNYFYGSSKGSADKTEIMKTTSPMK